MRADKTSAPLWWTFSAGAVGQFAELVPVGHYLDRVKIQQQSHPNQSMRVAIRQVGGTGMFRGLRWNALMGAFKGASRWTLNSGCFQFWDGVLPPNVRSDYPSCFSAAIGFSAAAMETTFFLCPLESLKTREMTTQWSGNKVHMWSVVKQEKIGIFYRGWNKLMARQSVTWTTYLIIYENYKQAVHRYNGGGAATTPQKILMGTATGITSSLLTTPFDVLKTQAQKANPQKERSIVRSAMSLARTFGAKGLYAGFPIKALRAGWYSTVTLLAMDRLGALPPYMKA